MRQKLIPTVLLCFGLAACADHSSLAIVTEDGPQAPINQPDTRIVDPGLSSSTSGSSSGTSNGAGGSLGSVATETGSSAGSLNGGAGSNSGGNGAGQAGGNSGTNGGSQNGGGSGGGSGSSPVPEPGTLLLVGTGLAGLAGISLRRRQRQNAKA